MGLGALLLCKLRPQRSAAGCLEKVWTSLRRGFEEVQPAGFNPFSAGQL